MRSFTINWILVVFSVAAMSGAVATDASANCQDTCTGEGYTESSCQGTAMFCDGDCDSVWGGAYTLGQTNPAGGVYWAGSCSSGSSCWSGSKACCCRKILDCKTACGSEGFSCVKVSDYDGGNIVGWCDDTYMCACGAPYHG